ncbi:MAG: amidohydrolase family protein, partial [bacterium]|nr:amidohydrolase family protein [bacterium]
RQDPSLLPARDVLGCATRDAARALGLGGEIGSLEPGKRADLILLDSGRPHLTPLYDVYSHLVYAAGRADVSTVMIHGRIVMRDRELLSVDEGRAIEDVRELSREIAAFVAN